MSDRVYVLKDGVVTAEVSPSEVGPSEVSERELHRLMVGRERVESVGVSAPGYNRKCWSASWTPAPNSFSATQPPAHRTASLTSAMALAGQAGSPA